MQAIDYSNQLKNNPNKVFLIRKFPESSFASNEIIDWDIFRTAKSNDRKLWNLLT